jgi:anaerobic magnesium-protoporphyrin IX monomethyl ester cyclase
MKIVFVTPPAGDGPPMIDLQYEPMGLLVITAELRQRGFEVVIIDAVLAELSTIATINVLAKHLDAAMIGFAVIGSNQVGPTDTIIGALRRNGYSGPICQGGAAATFLFPYIFKLSNPPDFIVRGEADLTVALLCEKLRDGEDWREAPGITYAKPDGEPVRNPQPALIEDLDTVPWPARDFAADVTRIGNPLSVITSRGCWAKCVFCNTPNFYKQSEGKPWRARSADSVVAEIHHLVDTYGAMQFQIFDDVFIGAGAAGRRRAFAIADGLKATSKPISFFCMTRAPEVDHEVFSEMRAAGLWSVCVGFESFSGTQLRRLTKGSNLEINKRAYRTLVDVGMPEIRMGNILFDPDSTLEEVSETLTFYDEIGYINPVKAHNTMTIDHDTAIYHKLKREGRLKGDWRTYSYDFADHRVAQMQRAVRQLLTPLAPIDTRISELKRYYHGEPVYLDACKELDRRLGLHTLSIIHQIENTARREVGDEMMQGLVGELTVDVSRQINDYHRRISVLDSLIRTFDGGHGDVHRRRATPASAIDMNAGASDLSY